MLSLEADTRKDTIADLWRVYWRSTLILALWAAILLCWFGDRSMPALQLGLLILVINTILFPGYLIARSIWRSSPVFFIVLCFLMGATPLFGALWGGGVILLGTFGFRVRTAFAVNLIIALVLCAGSFANQQAGWLTLPESCRIKTHGIFDKPVIAQHQEDSPTPGPEPIDPPPTAAAPTPVTPTHVTPPRATPAPAPTPAPTPIAFVEFRDPNGAYSLQLPDGFTQKKLNYRDGTKMLLDYGNDLSAVILASSMNKPWNAEEAMNEKADAIREGRAGGQLSRLKLENAALTPFPSGTGYTLLLSDKYGTALSMAAMVRVDRDISFSATITSTDAKNVPLYNTILSCLQKNLIIHGKQEVPKRTVSTPKPINEETAHIPTAETARERIKIQGVMEKSGIRSAMIDGRLHREGDSISVQDGTQTFVFRITRIGKDTGDVEFQPVPQQ